MVSSNRLNCRLVQTHTAKEPSLLVILHQLKSYICKVECLGGIRQINRSIHQKSANWDQTVRVFNLIMEDSEQIVEVYFCYLTI